MNFGDIKNVHFVGIGGIGMSGLAEVLSGAGVSVSGCDLKGSATTELLERRGIRFFTGHDADHVAGADLVVITSAVRPGNPEVDEARRRGTRVVKRAELLGEVVSRKRAVAVSGTHGKTTTSAMVSVVLEKAGLDPTILVGGVVRNIGTNARIGSGDCIVVEADEYDRSFHHLRPLVAIVTNIEADHLEYYGDLEAIVEAFRVFLAGVTPGGAIIACVDDPVVAAVLGDGSGFVAPEGVRVVGYGLSAAAAFRAEQVQFSPRGSKFEIAGEGTFTLSVPGEHNVRNALAAIAAARHLGVPASAISAALAGFLGVERRFQVLGEYNGAIVVDDYAHHPTEIRATIDAARRGYPERRLIALFQPHLYSRTREFAREFGEALRGADVPIVTPIYAAREEPIPGVSARLIAEAVEGVEFLDRGHDEIVTDLRSRLRAGDLFIAMGAGDVHLIPAELMKGEAA